MMNVSDVMALLFRRCEDSQAIMMVLKNRVCGLPVVDTKGKRVGMITERDRRAELGTEGRRPRGLDAVFGPGDAAVAPKEWK